MSASCVLSSLSGRRPQGQARLPRAGGAAARRESRPEQCTGASRAKGREQAELVHDGAALGALLLKGVVHVDDEGQRHLIDVEALEGLKK